MGGIDFGSAFGPLCSDSSQNLREEIGGEKR